MTQKSLLNEAQHTTPEPGAQIQAEVQTPTVAKEFGNFYSNRYQNTTTPNLRTCMELAVQCTQLVKIAQDRIKSLTEHNASLQAELIVLTEKETQTRHLAYHDELTGLPNRNLLQDRFHQAISQAKRRRIPLALLIMDLDKFKRVNDTLGHACGDKLLQAVATRLRKCIRGVDTACRYGGDEFVIMLTEIESPSIASSLAEKISKRLSRTYNVNANKLHITATIGIAVYPHDGDTFDDLMKKADMDMYRIKGLRQNKSINQPMEKPINSKQDYLTVYNDTDLMREHELLLESYSVSLWQK